MHLRKIFTLRLLLIMAFALAVSCRGKGAVQVSEFSDPNRALPSSITVVNWNAQKGENPLFASALKTLLEREKPDIVFLQEASTDFIKPQQMGGYLAESWSYPWPGGQTVGVLTLSRVTPIRVKPVPTKYREFDVTAPKVSLVTEYPLTNGETLLALNVHLLNFEVWSLNKIRHQLGDLKAIMARHRGPVVMAGDFNTWNQARLDLVKKITRDARLKEVTDFPEGRTTGDTGSEFWNDVLGVEGDLPLDRVFFSGFKPTTARVLSYNTSDHRPIMVQLELQP